MNNLSGKKKESNFFQNDIKIVLQVVQNQKTGMIHRNEFKEKCKVLNVHLSEEVLDQIFNYTSHQ